MGATIREARIWPQTGGTSKAAPNAAMARERRMSTLYRRLNFAIVKSLLILIAAAVLHPAELAAGRRLRIVHPVFLFAHRRFCRFAFFVALLAAFFAALCFCGLWGLAAFAGSVLGAGCGGGAGAWPFPFFVPVG